MPTLKYLIQSDKPHSPIYCRLSAGRGNVVKRKTGLTTNPQSWNKELGKMSGRTQEAKSVNASLAGLEEVVFERYNKDQMQGVTVDGFWLESVIAGYYNRKKEEGENIVGLVDYANEMIERLEYRVTRSKGKTGRGVSIKTRRKYQTVINKLRAFEKHYGKTIQLDQAGTRFSEDFDRFLGEIEKLSPNTCGRYVGTVKTFLRDARKNGHAVSYQLDDIKGYTVESPKVILSPIELESIRSVQPDSETLERARDWLIIGCYTGQRVSDLLRMNSDMIQVIKGFRFIVLKQVKTDKLVQIPIHPIVEDILSSRGGEFPESFGGTPDSSSALFNRYVKDVCKLAGIDEPTEGNLMNPKTGRSENGMYPKWQLISSHTCRRSFASNFYAEEDYPTPLLMNITAHSTEKQFLEYIGKKAIDYSLQLARLWSKKK